MAHRAQRGDPAIPAREVALVCLAAALLAVAMFWPLVLHLGRDVPLDLGDPLSQSWQVAWGGHALRHQPLDYFQSNQFWPLPDSLAFSDALAGYAPAGAVGSGIEAAVVRYDLLFLFSFALAFVGAHLLARELGAPPWAAAVAGAAFAYAPWRLEQGGHMHVLSSGGIPLSLFLLARGYRSGRPGMAVAGWAVAAWQVSLGFTLGLQLGYLLAVLGAIALVAWLRAGRPAPPAALLRATVAGVVMLAAVSAVMARPYMRVLDDHPESHRSASDVAAFSGPVTMFLAASSHDSVWGGATAPARDALPFVPEQTLFPGVAIVALAVAGLGWAGYRRRLRLGLGIAVIALAVLSLGFRDDGWGWLFPYRLLYEALPGWQGIRVPGRLNTLTSLGLALLAAAGAARLMAGRARLVAPALVAVVLLEGAGFAYPHPRVPPQPPGQRGAPAPQLHLPVRADDNRRYLLWSTDGFPDMVNGRSSFIPRQFEAVTRAVAGFPDGASVARLRRLGVRSVILHRDRLAGTPWAAWRSRPVDGLGLDREVLGGVVVYRLRG